MMQSIAELASNLSHLLLAKADANTETPNCKKREKDGEKGLIASSDQRPVRLPSARDFVFESQLVERREAWLLFTSIH